MASPNLSEIVTTTINHYSPTLADNVTTHNPLLYYLKRRGNVEPVSGGVKILENLKYAENSTVKWYSGYEALDVSASDVLSSAEFDWKQLNCNVTISGLEEIQNSSKEAMHNLLEARISVAEITMNNTVAGSLYSNGTGTGGKELTGLQAAVADTPTTGTYGGINRATSTNAFWRNQVVDGSSAAGTAVSASNIQTLMNKLWIRTVRNADMTDLITADANYYEFYWNSLQANQRFTSDRRGSAGFESVAYKGDTMVMYDSNCPANHMYFLNTRYLHWRPHSKRNFITDPERVSVNQDAVVVPLFFAGNLTCSNAARQGVLKA